MKERYQDVKMINRAIDRISELLDIYNALLKPLLGSEEFANRLINLLVFEMGKEGIELKEEVLNNIYQEIIDHLENGKYFLERNIVGIWASDKEIMDMISLHIKKIETMIEIEIQFPPEVRLVNREEVLALIDIINNVMKMFDRHLEIDRQERKENLENIAYPKDFTQKIANKIMKLVADKEDKEFWTVEGAKRRLEKYEENVQEYYKEFRNEVKKVLEEIRKFTEKNY